MLKAPRVSDYTTLTPHSIELDQALATAEAHMRTYRVRHLPVLEGGSLRGIVSERDIALVSALPSVSPDTVTVEEAMTPEPYAVEETALLSDVARHMAERRLSCAVVTRHGDIVGILTTTDALRALADVLTVHEASVPAGAVLA